MNKKAQLKTIQTAALVLIVLIVIIVAIIIPLRKKGEEISSLAPSSTIICAQKIGTISEDIDKDGLDDKDCDNCVCKQGCRNIKYDFTNPLKPTISDPRDDKDKDGLPEKCDKNDSDPSIVEWSEKCKENIRKSDSGKGICDLT